jgi:mannose-6-phosphate isomerase-like protein (cupin superfamily)
MLWDREISMKMKLILTGLFFAGFAVPAGGPDGFSLWKAADLKAFATSLAPKMNATKTATQQLTRFGNYSFMVAHREASGQAEFHAVQADIFVVESGEASLTVGGALVDGKDTGPNEMLGTSIKGGVESKLSAGDIVTIPAKTPHQLKLDAGKKFDYFVIKVTQ